MYVFHVLQAFFVDTKFEVRAEDRRSRAAGLEKRTAWGDPGCADMKLKLVQSDKLV